MFTTRIKGIKGAVKSMGNLRYWANVEIQNLSRIEAKEGAKFLIGLMPDQTGAMTQAVDTSTRQAHRRVIVSRTPKRTSWDGRKDRPYHIYYNFGKRGAYGRRKGAGTLKKSGEYGYYKKTYDYIKKRFLRKVLNSLKNK